MPKTAMLTLLAAATLGAGAALASERAAVEPTAPSFVRELGAARTATVGGTVLEVRPDGHFVLADAEDGRITVDAVSNSFQPWALRSFVCTTQGREAWDTV